MSVVGPIPVTQISWKPGWRIIPSRFPPVDLFRRIVPPEDWATLQHIEDITNERLRDGQSGVNLVRPEDRVGGSGSNYIMAAFAHPNPEGEWLSDGTFGICFVAETLDAALTFSIRRREDFLRRTGEGPMTLQMRVLNLDLNGMLHDLRGKLGDRLHGDPQYAKIIGQQLREQGSWGVICDPNISWAGPGAAIFRPSVLTNCRQERHLAFQWDGQRIAKVYDYSAGDDSEHVIIR